MQSKIHILSCKSLTFDLSENSDPFQTISFSGNHPLWLMKLSSLVVTFLEILYVVITYPVSIDESTKDMSPSANNPPVAFLIQSTYDSVLTLENYVLNTLIKVQVVKVTAEPLPQSSVYMGADSR